MDHRVDGVEMAQNIKPSYVGLGLWVVFTLAALLVVVTGYGVWWHWALASIVALAPCATIDWLIETMRGIRC